MKQYKALYYTGTSSKGFDALVYVQPELVTISYLNEGDEPVYVQWSFKEIKKLTTAGSITVFQYGAFPYQSIATDDAILIGLLRQKHDTFSNAYEQLLGGGWGLRIGLAAFFLGLIALFYLFLVPGAAVFLAAQMPKSAEIALGEQFYESIMLDYEEDTRLSRLANEFADQLRFDTEYPIQITVVREHQLNAFALPGGHIVVFDGLLHQLESPEAFAALLGHEVAHVKYQHSLKSITRTLSSYLFVSLVMGDLNGVSAVLVENADMLGRLSYSRELEESADNEALHILAANRLDQQGLVQLMETLEDANELMPIKLLSSHPLTQDRIQFAREHMQRESTPANNRALKAIWARIKKEQE